MNNNFLNMLLSVIAAVVSGVFVFLIGEIWKERCFDPKHNLKMIKQKIQEALIFYGNKLTNSVDTRLLEEKDYEIYGAASKEIRHLAGELRSIIPQLPNKKRKKKEYDKLSEASRKLIGLSNSIPCVNGDGVNMCQENRETKSEIYQLLDLPQED